ncbi:glycosyltransferase family 2 protein [Aspergillus neoniger CBS 115656]|uniref:Hyaluronan synthase n=1 Tax=Aspergillus neoniger (strain CBS 115656) TaxID=1448310 RepID=A0A318YSG2_ASPNB|nr:hyaluronan synthase [Aspergillus neoniger CBS 115656]PYH30928.1 hyaluronan synthase [Aspergillus neoniger CBS 115656]
MYYLPKPLKPHSGMGSGQRLVPLAERTLNFLGCIVAAAVYFYGLMYLKQPLTFDMIVSIILAEYCRWRNNKRRRDAALQEENGSLGLAEKGKSSEQRLDCVAAIVGYREEPTLWKQALGSYSHAQNCRFLLVCIDGDAEEDREMVEVFQDVYTEKSALMHLDIPLAEIAMQMDRARSSKTTDAEIIAQCCSVARAALEKSGITLVGEKGISKLCVSQPHMHKKGIMFTSFIISLVLSDILDIEFLWTSDSDSIVMPDTLTRTMATCAADPGIGGASTALTIHNKDETVITQLGNAVYLNELYLARSFTGAVAANDCQSGPSAAFRFSAVSGELLAWYKQSVFGHWMVVNEDRHLTTRLLLKGWKVVFASDVMTATESPTTFRRWLLQQVRWGRAVHVESFHRPSVYLMHSPILFFGALRRQFAAFVVPLTVVLYLCSGMLLIRAFSFQDYTHRLGLTISYLVFRNPYRPTMKEWMWSLPAHLFYHVPLPAIQVWSFLTVLHDSWGTTMRANKEVRHSKLRLKIWEVGFFVFWMAILGGASGRYVATSLMPGSADVVVFILAGVVSVLIVGGWWTVVAK